VSCSDVPPWMQAYELVALNWGKAKMGNEGAVLILAEGSQVLPNEDEGKLGHKGHLLNGHRQGQGDLQDNSRGSVTAACWHEHIFSRRVEL
jgi:hypothetical protein